MKDGKDEDLTQEPEMIQAFRDTWELGIHSYLTYLRDRLLLRASYCTKAGRVFVQISDENLHHVRELMDEVFGATNFVCEHRLPVNDEPLESGRASSNVLTTWSGTAETRARVKYRNLYR